MAHVFISYVREDSAAVERLCDSLRQNGIRTWIDRNDIRPGTRWKRSIRKAIDQGDFFVACFSPNYISRSKTYMNEELTIAVELLRRMPADRAWFIPVLLNECEVPDRDIGAGETLLDIQQVRLYENWDLGIDRILTVIKPNEAGESHGVSPEVKDDAISILFLAANPFDTSLLRADEELREIQTSLLQSLFRDRFQIEIRMAVRLNDLREAFLQIRPRIVHFSGHGTSSGELIFEDERGKSAPLGADALRSLFRLVPGGVECVVLNCNHSSEMAKKIGSDVKYVIGMKRHLTDKLAISFSTGFYRALAFGRTIEEAFELGRSHMALIQEAGRDVPLLVVRDRG